MKKRKFHAPLPVGGAAAPTNPAALPQNNAKGPLKPVRKLPRLAVQTSAAPAAPAPPPLSVQQPIPQIIPQKVTTTEAPVSLQPSLCPTSQRRIYRLPVVNASSLTSLVFTGLLPTNLQVLSSLPHAHVSSIPIVSLSSVDPESLQAATETLTEATLPAFKLLDSPLPDRDPLGFLHDILPSVFAPPCLEFEAEEEEDEDEVEVPNMQQGGFNGPSPAEINAPFPQELLRHAEDALASHPLLKHPEKSASDDATALKPAAVTATTTATKRSSSLYVWVPTPDVAAYDEAAVRRTLLEDEAIPLSFLKALLFT